MELKIPDEQMRQLVASAILEKMDPAQRDKLLTEAIASLMATKKTTHYGASGTTELQESFNQAAALTARSIIVEKLTKDAGFNAEVERLIADVARKLFVEKREKLVDDLVNTLTHAINKVRDY